MINRTLVIGDIHNGYKSLVQVLERSKYDAKTDDLIFLGDYVDGHSQAAEVVEHIVGLKKEIETLGRHKDSIICLEGNHDTYLKDFLNFGTVSEEWLSNGGITTLSSYNSFWGAEDQTSLEAHRDFFNGLHSYYVDTQNRGFVHGGCVDEGIPQTIPYERKWNRSMWNRCLSGKTMKAYKELYIGHTTTMLYTCKKHFREAEFQEVNKPVTVPMKRQNVWNLDTGGGGEGKLTIMDIDTKEFWQSDFLSELYPEE